MEDVSPSKSNFNMLNLYLQKLMKGLELLDSSGRTLRSVFDFTKGEVGIRCIRKRRLDDELKVRISNHHRIH